MGHQEAEHQLPQAVEQQALPLVEDLAVLALLLPLQPVQQHLPEPRDARADVMPHLQARLNVKTGAVDLELLPVERAAAEHAVVVVVVARAEEQRP